jgi:hypothetical protein
MLRAYTLLNNLHLIFLTTMFPSLLMTSSLTASRLITALLTAALLITTTLPLRCCCCYCYCYLCCFAALLLCCFAALLLCYLCYFATFAALLPLLLCCCCCHPSLTMPLLQCLNRRRLYQTLSTLLVLVRYTLVAPYIRGFLYGHPPV